MRLSYLIPDGQYSFFRQMVPALEARGVDVQVNRCDGADAILAAMLPITHDWLPSVSHWIGHGLTAVLWHWDLYSFTDYAEPRWAGFLDLLSKAGVVWSGSYETARELLERVGVRSRVVPAWVDVEELDAAAARADDVTWNPYALYAAGSSGFGKRVDWAERACKLAGMPLKVVRNQGLPRGEYLRLLTECQVYVMTAFEESNGTIPAMEAAAMGKTLVLADLPASREVFGDCLGVHWFPPNDFGALLRCVRNVAHAASPLPRPNSTSPHWEGLSTRVRSLYSLDGVADLIVKELRYALTN